MKTRHNLLVVAALMSTMAMGCKGAENVGKAEQNALFDFYVALQSRAFDGACMEVEPGKSPEPRPCTGKESQMWKLLPGRAAADQLPGVNPHGYNLINQETGQCLSARISGELVMAQCNVADGHQLWIPTQFAVGSPSSWTRLRNSQLGTFLKADLESQSFVSANYDGESHLDFRTDRLEQPAFYRLTHVSTGECYEEDLTNQLVRAACNGSDRQKWYFLEPYFQVHETGAYMVINRQTFRCVVAGPVPARTAPCNPSLSEMLFETYVAFSPGGGFRLMGHGFPFNGTNGDFHLDPIE